MTTAIIEKFHYSDKKRIILITIFFSFSPFFQLLDDILIFAAHILQEMK